MYYQKFLRENFENLILIAKAQHLTLYALDTKAALQF